MADLRRAALTALLAATALIPAAAQAQDQAGQDPAGQEQAAPSAPTPAEAGLTTLSQFAELGEPKYPPDFAHFDYVNPDAPKGGSVRLWAYGSFETLNPLREAQQWAAGLGLAADSLMSGSADELYSYYPSIAMSVSVPDDLSYAIFNLNPAARWNDGEPITADDFVFAYDTITQHARVFLKSLYQDLTDVTAIDPLHLRVDFATTDNRKTLGVAAGLSPMPEHYWTQAGRDVTASYLEPPVSEGAYRIVDVDPGRSVTYQRVEDWWARDLPVNVGQANFDRITYTYYRDIDVAFEAFKGGAFDFWTENRAQRWATGYDIPAVANGALIKLEAPDNSPQGIQAFLFNTRKPKFADPRVREAIGLLFDFEWTNRTLFYGQYSRIKSYFPNSSFGVQDLGPPEGREMEILEPYRDQLPERLFTEKFEPPVADGSGSIRPQQREALRLLREAGWEVRDNRLVDARTGERMTIQFLENQADAERYIQPFIENLKRAGIDASLRIVDTSQYERLTTNFDFDMLSIQYTFYPPPGPLQQSYFGSADADVQGSANYVGIKNPVVDALLAQMIATDDLAEMEATSRALDRVLLWNHYSIPQWYLDISRNAYWDLFARPETLPVYGIGFPGAWWWDPKPAALAATGRT